MTIGGGPFCCGAAPCSTKVFPLNKGGGAKRQGVVSLAFSMLSRERTDQDKAIVNVAIAQ